jgi:hypothetical protein
LVHGDGDTIHDDDCVVCCCSRISLSPGKKTPL